MDFEQILHFNFLFSAVLCFTLYTHHGWIDCCLLRKRSLDLRTHCLEIFDFLINNETHHHHIHIYLYILQFHDYWIVWLKTIANNANYFIHCQLWNGSNCSLFLNSFKTEQMLSFQNLYDLCNESIERFSTPSHTFSVQNPK